METVENGKGTQEKRWQGTEGGEGERGRRGKEREREGSIKINQGWREGGTNLAVLKGMSASKWWGKTVR
jgi:hypothetical protein